MINGTRDQKNDYDSWVTVIHTSELKGKEPLENSVIAFTGALSD